MVRGDLEYKLCRSGKKPPLKRGSESYRTTVNMSHECMSHPSTTQLGESFFFVCPDILIRTGGWNTPAPQCRGQQRTQLHSLNVHKEQLRGFVVLQWRSGVELRLALAGWLPCGSCMSRRVSCRMYRLGSWRHGGARFKPVAGLRTQNLTWSASGGCGRRLYVSNPETCVGWLHQRVFQMPFSAATQVERRQTLNPRP